MKKTLLFLLALVITIALFTVMSEVRAGEPDDPCVTYKFTYPEDEQLFSDQYPYRHLAQEEQGRQVPADTYDVSIRYGDNNRHQLQEYEAVYAAVYDEDENELARSAATPDLPDDPDADPDVWVWETVNVGEMVVEEPFDTLAAVHAFIGETGRHSVSVSHITLEKCQPTSTPTATEPPATATATGTITPTTSATATATATATQPPNTPTPTPKPSVFTFLFPLLRNDPTAAATPTPTATPTQPPATETPEPLACSRFNLEVAGQTTPDFGTYHMYETATGNLLASWDAEPGWEDSGWRHFPITWQRSEVRVTFEYHSGSVVALRILNSPFVERGSCHAVEIAFP